MNEFYITKLSDKKYSFLAMSLSYESILNYIIELEHKINGASGTILIDQLLSTGNNKNRFIQCVVNKGKINLSSAQNVNPSMEIIKKSEDIFRKHPNAIEYSILTRSAKEKLLNNY